MSDAIQQAEELRTKAISLLLSERQTIDAALANLGHTGASAPTTRKCTVCGEEGHTARKHKNGPAVVAEP